MSEFSAQWLGLREPVDHRSRNQDLQAQVMSYLAQIKTVHPGSVRLTDLGSGTGSNLRALAPQLNSMQHWTLIDYDAALLHTARTTLLAWADSEIQTSILGLAVNPSAQVKPLSIIKQNKTIVVEFKCIDLYKDYRAILDEPADIITAAAFFDLVAEPWLSEFCTYLSKPLYTVLTYDGIEKWSPPEMMDVEILKAFHQHQRTDKGFGSALGPSAAERMQSLLQGRDFKVVSAQSNWMMDDHDRDLIEQLATGTARALREIGTLPNLVVDQWEKNRRQASNCEIGHVDLFAYK
ncbi:hypothetical protein PSHI8_05060 [Polynucleobacter sp. SHI8]|uniref:hypothetical protein n=1 Tax=unclassified Polynucleobacter TaxID=2640945 RepID=UPI002490FA5E|nr:MULTISPECIES: hypothetical protein [unclassified Polynucleobacter]BDW10424.1 hypothetical protein PSHI2_05060 [Polynucleobacter sp. SHI2]BDW12870.1 hypothetical protein PSHI8_05060 [Polynucleobacter sp. SHI8]